MSYPALYYETFPYAPSAAEGVKDLVQAAKHYFETHGYSDIQTNNIAAWARTADSRVFALFVSAGFENTFAVICAAGADAKTLCANIATALKNLAWL